MTYNLYKNIEDANEFVRGNERFVEQESQGNVLLQYGALKEVEPYIFKIGESTKKNVLNFIWDYPEWLNQRVFWFGDADEEGKCWDEVAQENHLLTLLEFLLVKDVEDYYCVFFDEDALINELFGYQGNITDWIDEYGNVEMDEEAIISEIDLYDELIMSENA